MTHPLTLSLPIKQDPQTLQKLKELEAIFTDKVQPLIDAALRKSKIVHFARVVIIDDKYIQVITEYEGSHQEYTEFFRRELTPVFAAIFALADGMPDVGDPDGFWKFSKAHNYRTLGKATDGALDFDGNPAGWLFSAYDGKTVKDLLAALGEN